MIRAFVGIDLPEPHRDALERLQESLPMGRPVPSENLHMTLAFLGEQPEWVLEEVHFALEHLKVVGAVVEIAGLGSFGRRLPSVVHGIVTGDARLRRLRDKVRSAAHTAGVDLPRERFRPHVTLARMPPRPAPEGLERLRVWLERHGGFRLPPVAVGEITLYRSTLTRAGAVHDRLASYPVCQSGDSH